MKIDSNTTIKALREDLDLLSLDVTEGGRRLLEEVSNRLELLDIENTDLRMALSREKQDSNFWQQKATEAMNRIRRLEDAGDAMVDRWICTNEDGKIIKSPSYSKAELERFCQ